jgi:ATP-dependent HslUV protease ATP-binding subunit HslU
VGYVGRDVEQIVRDLLDAAIVQVREQMREDVRAKAVHAAEERVITAIAGEDARPRHSRGVPPQAQVRRTRPDSDRAGACRQFLPLRHAQHGPARPAGHRHGLPGRPLRQGHAPHHPQAHDRVESYDTLLNEEADKLLDDETVTRAALEAVEQNGIVFLDEIDKVCARAETRGADVSREGCSAISCRSSRARRSHQARAGQDGPHPLHRLGRLPHRQASDLLPELQAACPSGWSCSLLPRTTLSAS